MANWIILREMIDDSSLERFNACSVFRSSKKSAREKIDNLSRETLTNRPNVRFILAKLSKKYEMGK